MACSSPLEVQPTVQRCAGWRRLAVHSVLSLSVQVAAGGRRRGQTAVCEQQVVVMTRRAVRIATRSRNPLVPCVSSRLVLAPAALRLPARTWTFGPRTCCRRRLPRSIATPPTARPAAIPSQACSDRCAFTAATTFAAAGRNIASSARLTAGLHMCHIGLSAACRQNASPCSR